MFFFPALGLVRQNAKVPIYHLESVDPYYVGSRCDARNRLILTDGDKDAMETIHSLVVSNLNFMQKWIYC